MISRGPVNKRQNLQQALSVLQLHGPTQRTTGPRVSTVVFTRSVFFIKSAFRNVYSLVHVYFHLICAPQQEGLCVCWKQEGGECSRCVS